MLDNIKNTKDEENVVFFIAGIGLERYRGGNEMKNHYQGTQGFDNLIYN